MKIKRTVIRPNSSGVSRQKCVEGLSPKIADVNRNKYSYAPISRDLITFYALPLPLLKIDDTTHEKTDFCSWFIGPF